MDSRKIIVQERLAQMRLDRVMISEAVNEAVK